MKRSCVQSYIFVSWILQKTELYFLALCFSIYKVAMKTLLGIIIISLRFLCAKNSNQYEYKSLFIIYIHIYNIHLSSFYWWYYWWTIHYIYAIFYVFYDLTWKALITEINISRYSIVPKYWVRWTDISLFSTYIAACEMTSPLSGPSAVRNRNSFIK